jgi:hypothetical protein
MLRKMTRMCYHLPMSEAAVCVQCQKPKAHLSCGICQETICKKCAEFIDDDTFAYMNQVPEVLLHSCYCHNCFEKKVRSHIDEYQMDIEKAKDVFVFYRSQGKETSQFKRTQLSFQVEDCLDEADTLMRLAYQTVKADCNAIIDVNVQGKKVRDHAYQTTRWQGTGNPTQVDAEKLTRMEDLRKLLQSR